MFTRGLAEFCQRELGVSFEMETTIRGIDVAGGRVERIITDKGDFTADHYVLSLGSYSPFVARKIGINLPIYPVKGYSVTLPVGPEHEAPTLGGVDEENLVAFTRMGDRLRLTATAEFSGYDTTHKPSDFATMLGRRPRPVSKWWRLFAAHLLGGSQANDSGRKRRSSAMRATTTST